MNDGTIYEILLVIVCVCGLAIFAMGTGVLYECLVQKFFPCKMGNLSHRWEKLPWQLKRRCMACSKCQEGREVMIGLGIVAEGETKIVWSDCDEMAN